MTSGFRGTDVAAGESVLQDSHPNDHVGGSGHGPAGPHQHRIQHGVHGDSLPVHAHAVHLLHHPHHHLRPPQAPPQADPVRPVPHGALGALCEHLRRRVRDVHLHFPPFPARATGHGQEHELREPGVCLCSAVQPGRLVRAGEEVVQGAHPRGGVVAGGGVDRRSSVMDEMIMTKAIEGLYFVANLYRLTSSFSLLILSTSHIFFGIKPIEGVFSSFFSCHDENRRQRHIQINQSRIHVSSKYSQCIYGEHLVQKSPIQ